MFQPHPYSCPSSSNATVCRHPPETWFRVKDSFIISRPQCEQKPRKDCKTSQWYVDCNIYYGRRTYHSDHLIEWEHYKWTYSLNVLILQGLNLRWHKMILKITMTQLPILAPSKCVQIPRISNRDRVSPPTSHQFHFLTLQSEQSQTRSLVENVILLLW